MNTTMLWGAPFNNLTLEEITFDIITQKIIVTFGFENHSPIHINGTMNLEIYNNRNQSLGSGTIELGALSGSNYRNMVEVPIDSSKLTENGQIHFQFIGSIFNIDSIIIDW